MRVILEPGGAKTSMSSSTLELSSFQPSMTTLRGAGIRSGHLSIVKCCDPGGGIFSFSLDRFRFAISASIVDLLSATTTTAPAWSNDVSVARTKDHAFCVGNSDQCSRVEHSPGFLECLTRQTWVRIRVKLRTIAGLKHEIFK